MLQRLDRQIILHIASVQACRWLEKQDVNFFFCNRAMLHAVRDDQKLALFDPHMTVTKLHAKSAFHDQE